MIYLDNAATSLRKPQAVTDAVVEAMQTVGIAAAPPMTGTRRGANGLFGAAGRRGLLRLPARRPRRLHREHHRVAEHRAERPALPRRPCDRDRSGAQFRAAAALPAGARAGRGRQLRPADRRGQIDYAAFEALLRPQTRLVVTTHASNLTGNVLDIAKIADFAAGMS